MKKTKEKIFKVVGNNQKDPGRGDGRICNCVPGARGMGGGIYTIHIFRD